MLKRFLIFVCFLQILLFNVALAKIYNMSEIEMCKTISEYGSNSTINQIDTVIFGSYYQSNYAKYAF